MSELFVRVLSKQYPVIFNLTSEFALDMIKDYVLSSAKKEDEVNFLNHVKIKTINYKLYFSF